MHIANVSSVTYPVQIVRSPHAQAQDESMPHVHLNDTLDPGPAARQNLTWAKYWQRRAFEAENYYWSGEQCQRFRPPLTDLLSF